MTTITVCKKNGFYLSFESKGHASFAGFGKDIVCAAISILVINTANALEQFTEDALVIEEDEKNGRIYWEFTDVVSDKSILLMDTLLLGLKTIHESYEKKHTQIIFKEV